MKNSSLFLALGLIAATAWPALAQCPPDCPVGGRRIKMGSRSSDLRMTIQTEAEASDAFPANQGPNDPAVNGATLRVFTTVGDMFDVTYQLPRDKWHYVGNVGDNGGYNYKDTTSQLGPIKLIFVRPNQGLKIKGGGDLMFSLHNNPNPVQAVLTFGTTRLCLAFGGLATFTPDTHYRAVRAPAPASCP